MKITQTGSSTLYEEEPDDNQPAPVPDAPPTCTHCGATKLHKQGIKNGKQRYRCVSCRRTTNGYTVPKAFRPPCPYCKNKHVFINDHLSYGRTRYQCRACHTTFNDISLQAPWERGAEPCPHRLNLCLGLAERDNLVAYCNATGLSLSAAVRAIFRNVLTGTVFWTIVSAKAAYDDSGRCVGVRTTAPRTRAIERDPQAAATPLRDLRSETFRRQKAERGDRALGIICGAVTQITVMLDDKAKEGLIYAMGRTGKNHADTARILLARATVPEPLPQNQRATGR